MRIGILGSGIVAQTLGSKLVALGHDVRLGSREANNEKGGAWVRAAGARASHGTFADAAGFGALLFNATAGAGSLGALGAVPRGTLAGKILVDVANPLDFSKGMPPTLTVSNTDSLGEQIQRTFPELRVVKALNTVNCEIMVDPALVSGEHDLLICGNDAGAKTTVANHLRDWFGWRSILDLGDISAARGTEAYLLLWIRLWGALGTPTINVHVQPPAAKSSTAAGAARQQVLAP